MTTIRITTDRLPQPARHKGAVLEVTPEKAASMVAQGFAEIIAAPAPAAPAQSAPKAPPSAAAVVEDITATPRRRRALGGAL